MHGPKPMIINSDSALIRFSICNGLRNAVEIMQEINAQEAHPVIVAWGEGGNEYWISVLDRGPGLNSPPEFAFEIGKTTKENHTGFGLAIAKRAIETLDGEIFLEPAQGGGTKFEIRWPK